MPGQSHQLQPSGPVRFLYSMAFLVTLETAHPGLVHSVFPVPAGSVRSAETERTQSETLHQLRCWRPLTKPTYSMAEFVRNLLDRLVPPNLRVQRRQSDRSSDEQPTTSRHGIRRASSQLRTQG